MQLTFCCWGQAGLFPLLILSISSTRLSVGDRGPVLNEEYSMLKCDGDSWGASDLDPSTMALPKLDPASPALRVAVGEERCSGGGSGGDS
jgi:hypothetical protein